MNGPNESRPSPSGDAELPIDASATPPPPAFGCIVYFCVRDGVYRGRVANLAGIQETGSSQRELLGKIVRRFQSEISGSLNAGTDPNWIDPLPAKNEDEQKLFLPVHL